MFTWFQQSFHKHHKIILGLVLALMISSFVFYGFGGQGDERGFSGKFVYKGVNLADDRATRDARDLAALLSRRVHTDDFLKASLDAARLRKAGQKTDDRVFNYFLGVVDRLATADALGIPRPDDKELAVFIRSYPDFQDKSGTFSPETLKAFSDYARGTLGLDERRLQGALADAWRLQKLTSLSEPAVPPALDPLAERLVGKLRASWTVETAAFARAGFTAKVGPAAKGLSDYFEKNKERYRIPEKLRLRVARVTGDPKTADVLPAPSDAELLALAGRRRDQFPLVGISTDEHFLKDNRVALVGAWREEKAGENVAANLSEKLVTAVPIGDARPDTAKLDAMLKTAGLEAKTLPAYGADALPAGTGVPDPLLKSALELSPTRWRTSAIPFGAEAFVFVYDGAEPSRLSTLDEARARVTSDYTAEETSRLFAEAATAKARDIAATVKTGKPFAEAATAAGYTPAPAVTFEYAKAPENLAPDLEGLESLPVGGVSSALRNGTDRLVAHIVARSAPTGTKDAVMQDRARNYFGRKANEATLGGGVSSGSDE